MATLNGIPPPDSTITTNGNGSKTDLAFDSIPDCIEAFARGEFLIVLDSPQRENEGDLIISASHLTTSKSSFLIRHTSGYLCAPLPSSLADSLNLPLMIPPTAASDPNKTAYTISIDADHSDVTTGISAHDRALTCRLLAQDGVKENQFRRPGHILPLRAREGGIRVRRGHTEAATEFCRLAGLKEVGVIGEMVRDGEDFVTEGRKVPEYKEGGMMRRDECLEFGREWGIRVCTIEALVEWVEEKEGKLKVEGSDY